jgi:hypothetical protein
MRLSDAVKEGKEVTIDFIRGTVQIEGETPELMLMKPPPDPTLDV